MSVVPVSTSTSQSSQTIGTQILQQLLSQGTSTQDTSGLSGILGDLMTLSPAAQQLQQAPNEVTQAMGDLFSGQTDVQGDLATLKTYFQQNPESLTSMLSSLQGTSGTYGTATGGSSSTQALLAALLNGQSSSSSLNPVSLLLSATTQDSLFSVLNDSSSSASTNPISLFG